VIIFEKKCKNNNKSSWFIAWGGIATFFIVGFAMLGTIDESFTFHYQDIPSWEPVFNFAPFAFFQTLVQAKMTCGIDKILFGTDWPLFSPILSLERWVKGIKKNGITATA